MSDYSWLMHPTAGNQMSWSGESSLVSSRSRISHPRGAQPLSCSDVGDVHPGLDDRVGGDDTECMKGVTRSGIVLGTIAAVVAAVVVVALLLALRPPTEFDPGTPEAAVQGYFQAVADRSRVDAKQFMTPELVERCVADLNEIRHTPDSLRVVIVATEPDGDQTLVTVEITERPASSLFLGESYTFEETLVLERSGDVWLIAEAPWPIYCWEV